MQSNAIHLFQEVGLKVRGSSPTKKLPIYFYCTIFYNLLLPLAPESRSETRLAYAGHTGRNITVESAQRKIKSRTPESPKTPVCARHLSQEAVQQADTLRVSHTELRGLCTLETRPHERGRVELKIPGNASTVSSLDRICIAF